MRRPNNRVAALLLAGAALVGLPVAGIAIGQQSPESLLPEGFGAPPPPATPAGAPVAPGQAPPAAAGAPAAGPSDPIGSIIAQLGDETTPEATAAEDEEAAEDDAPPEMPDAARRLLSPAGVSEGYGADAFGVADGRFLSVLMNRMRAPIASRWMQIALRRALLTRVETPAEVEGADWVAARAALLLRLGEADGARMLVQGVDVVDFSPRLRTAAIGAALATADPAGLCPLPDGAEQIGGVPMWPMVRAMCASLSGEPGDAGAFPRRSGGLPSIDIQVAEKVVGAGPTSRRSVVLDWTLVDTLDDWRYGLAYAVGAAAPDDLAARSAPRFRAYAARAPMLPLDRRAAMARTAVTLGVLSAQDLVDLYGQMLEAQGDYDRASPPGLLREAYVGDDDAARLTALRALWSAADTPEAVYATQILTARAAARIDPAKASADDLPLLVASLLAAGLDRQAARFAGAAAAADGAAGDKAWAILAAGGIGPTVPITRKRVADFAKRAGDDPESGGPHRTRMLVAALAGQGRIGGDDLNQLAGGSGLDLGRDTAWTRAIARAAGRGEKGTVILLAATAMQTGNWQAVPPNEFYRLIAALREAGLEPEARMIAAEAMTRL